MTKRADNEKRNWFRWFLDDFRDHFNLREDSAPQSKVIEDIGRNVLFRGTTIWILIFATVLACVGLNVNNLAPIFGAMLISPLMGPIMGFGLSLGINDFDLMKRSFRNFCYMTGTAIVTATLYFLITPISMAQSELLARTTPTFYDVLIAFVGGLAGVVSYTRRNPSFYIITGVAIATALLPPLCTAGYGIATMKWEFFGGGLYLYFINVIFIALSTYTILRILKYKKITFVEPKTERRVRRIMWGIIVVAVLPSIFIAFRLINKSVFEYNANRFVAAEFSFDDTRVLEQKNEYVLDAKEKPRTITLVLYGETLSEDMIENIRRKMPIYDLFYTNLVVKQSGVTAQLDFTPLQQGYAQVLDEKNRQILELRRQVERSSQADSLALREIVAEFEAIIPGMESVSMSKQPVWSAGGQAVDTMFVCIVKPSARLSRDDIQRLERWLKIKSKTDNVKIYVE